MHQRAVIAAIEPANESLKRISSRMVRSFVMHILDKPRAEERHHRKRHKVGGKQREHNRKCKSGEKKPAHSVQKDDWKKDNRSGKRCCENRKRNLPASFFRRNLRRLSIFQMMED